MTGYPLQLKMKMVSSALGFLREGDVMFLTDKGFAFSVSR